MSNQQHLFVYGTLRREFNHPLAQRLARQAHLIGQGTVPGRLYDLGDYPGLVPASIAGEQVLGDVYRLADPVRLLPILDDYEECIPTDPFNSLYLRQEITVSLAGGGSRRAWVYLFNRPVKSFRLIPFGDYLRYLQSK